MCRIAGWMRLGEDKASQEELVSLLTNMQVGDSVDATGVGWLNGRYFALKHSRPAVDFVATKAFLGRVPTILESPWVILHTRNATHGSPDNNDNNHPIMNDSGMIIHNGVVFTREELESRGETDSEQIMLHIQKYGWAGIKNFLGTMSIAYVDFAESGFYLYTNNGFLIWALDPDRNIVWFCSTEHILLNSIHYSTVLGVFPRILLDRVPQNTVFHITDKIEEVAKVETRKIEANQGHTYYPPQNRRISFW